MKNEFSKEILEKLNTNSLEIISIRGEDEIEDYKKIINKLQSDLLRISNLLEYERKVVRTVNKIIDNRQTN